MPILSGTPAGGPGYGTLTLTATPGLGDVGQAVRFTAVILNASGTLVDPATLTLTATAADGTTTTTAIGAWTRVSAGLFTCDQLPATLGVLRAAAVSTVPNAADDVTITVAATSTQAWTPTADDIAGLLAQRTVDATGIPTGRFSVTTSPTSAQVDVSIADIAGEVTATCGPIPAILTADAKLVTKLGAAWLVETSFDDDTASDALATMYATRYQLALARLATAVAQVNQSGQVEPEGMPAIPLFGFPDIAGDVYVDVTTKYTRW
jgi:hypothetical protein